MIRYSNNCAQFIYACYSKFQCFFLFCSISPIPLRLQPFQQSPTFQCVTPINDLINCLQYICFLTDYPVVLKNISRYRCTMAYTEANTLRLELENQTAMFTGVWEAAKLISDDCYLTRLQKSVLNYCERSWKPISNKTDKDQHWVLRESLGFMRPGCMREANRSPAWLRILTEPKTKGGKCMSEMSAHTLRLHLSYQSSLAYPCVHETRRDTSKSFFESVERLDSLSRFFFGAE